MLCSIPEPPAGLVPRARAFFLLLEAVFTILFHGCTAMITDSYLQTILLWPRSSVAWNPLCSHLSLNEHIRGDLSLTAEELELAAAIRKARAKDTRNIISQRFRAKRRAQDLDGYRAAVTKMKTAWNEKNPEKMLETAAKVRAKALDEQRFYCSTCQMALQSATALDIHNKTRYHLDRVAGIEKPPITKSAVAVKKVTDNARKNKTHYCSTCQKSFGKDWDLQRHLKTPLHAKRLAKKLAQPIADQSDHELDI